MYHPAILYYIYINREIILFSISLFHSTTLFHFLLSQLRFSSHTQPKAFALSFSKQLICFRFAVRFLLCWGPLCNITSRDYFSPARWVFPIKSNQNGADRSIWVCWRVSQAYHIFYLFPICREALRNLRAVRRPTKLRILLQIIGCLMIISPVISTNL